MVLQIYYIATKLGQTTLIFHSEKLQQYVYAMWYRWSDLLTHKLTNKIVRNIQVIHELC